MEKLAVDKQIRQAVRILKNGGVIAYPTDTIYGIGCDVLNQKAINKVFELKGRDFSKPLSIACLDIKMVKKYTFVPAKIEKIFDHLLPGPFTILLKKKKPITNLVTAGLKKVGVRVPDSELCLQIIKEFGQPIITTSANISGKEEILNYKDLQIPVDFIVKGKCKFNQPSTLFDPENKKILREGAEADKLTQFISN
jgi:L-threonylcarbamoyladenylate synthase